MATRLIVNSCPFLSRRLRRQDRLATSADYVDRGLLAFGIGAAAGIPLGFWLARHALLSAVFEPYIKMLNALPRVVLAPIFMLWLGLGIWSKVALGVTLVFFIVFFNGAGREKVARYSRQRPHARHERAPAVSNVYWPSALSWMFSSLHTSVGFALIGAVVGEYMGPPPGWAT